MPAPFDTPFMQRALVEALLLAGLAGVLGSWIVLRRMAFFTHGVGTAAFPGLVVAVPRRRRAAAHRPRGRARSTPAGSSGSRARAGSRPTPRRACVLVAALAIGAILASDVFESGAGVDRLLFGSLIGLRDRDLWLTAAALAARAGAARRAAPRRGSRRASTPAPPGRSACAPRWPTACCCSPIAVAGGRGARRGRRAARDRRARDPGGDRAARGAERRGRCRSGTVALAAVEGVAGLWLAYELNVGPGPAIAVLGGGVFAIVMAVTRMSVRVEDLAGGYAPGSDVAQRRLVRARRPGRSPPCSARTAAARRRCSARCSASCRCGAGRSSSPALPAYVPQTDRTRLDFPVSALDVVLMGAYARTPVWRRIARADREAARATLERVGLADRARARFGDALRRPAPARADRPRAAAGQRR